MLRYLIRALSSTVDLMEMEYDLHARVDLSERIMNVNRERI